MANSGLMPSNHTFVKAHDWFIEVDEYSTAILEFHDKKHKVDDAATFVLVLSIKYGIDKVKLLKLVGL